MTPPESLSTLGWGATELARQIGRPDATVASWLRRGTVPPEIADWLADLAAYRVAHPAPEVWRRVA